MNAGRIFLRNFFAFTRLLLGVDDYPEAIVRQLRPQTIVLGHWESFFRSPDRPLQAIPFTDTKAFALRLTDALPEGARWYTPRPNATLRICPRR